MILKQIRRENDENEDAARFDYLKELQEKTSSDSINEDIPKKMVEFLSLSCSSSIFMANLCVFQKRFIQSASRY